MRTPRLRRAGAAWVLAALLGACASTPPPPDWQLNAKTASERAVAAYLDGDAQIAALELAQARRETARTGRADLLARIELTHCAAATASLVVQLCAGFEALRVDAGSAEVAYSNYLSARLTASDVALLPLPQRGVAALLVGPPPTDPATTLRAIDAPLSRLVAAGVLFTAGRADPGVIDVATETASAQGWRRPLLAWLGVQLRRAELSANDVEVQRLRRRIARVQGGDGPTAP